MAVRKPMVMVGGVPAQLPAGDTIEGGGGGGGGSVGNLVQRIIMYSQEFTAPRDGSYRVTAIGGGASGGRSATSGNGLRATGGGAGGFAQKVVQLAKGDVLTCIIGAGGAAQTVAAQDGADGGTTTVTGPGISLTASGGKGGLHGLGAGTTLGAEGGTASGGDVNVTGGGSGSATTVAVANSMAATGGGAVGIFGVGYSSGDAESAGGVTALTYGAGVGGKSGNAYASTSNTTAAAGGPWGPSGDMVNGDGVGVMSVYAGNNTNAVFESGLSGGVWAMGISAFNNATGYGQSGRFAGGTPQTTSTNAGGVFGGGAGGRIIEATSYSGGIGGVIIEYMESW